MRSPEAQVAQQRGAAVPRRRRAGHGRVFPLRAPPARPALVITPGLVTSGRPALVISAERALVLVISALPAPVRPHHNGGRSGQNSRQPA